MSVRRHGGHVKSDCSDRINPRRRCEFYRRLRESVGSREEVARLLGLNVRTLRRRESGENRINDEMVAALEFVKSKGKNESK